MKSEELGLGVHEALHLQHHLVSGFGFRLSGVGFWVQALGFRGWGLGFKM